MVNSFFTHGSVFIDSKCSYLSGEELKKKNLFVFPSGLSLVLYR